MKVNRPQQKLLAYYKTTVGAFFSVGGLLLALYSLWAAIRSDSLFLALAAVGVVLFMFGFYSLNRPCFLLEPNQLTVYNLLGGTTKRYTFESWEFVKADNRRIYIDKNGITIKVSVLPWLVKADDWMTMRKML